MDQPLIMNEYSENKRESIRDPSRNLVIFGKDFTREINGVASLIQGKPAVLKSSSQLLKTRHKN